MLNCPDLDPAIANAAYMEFRASAAWLFDETTEEMSSRGRYALAAIEDLRPATALEARVAAQAIASDAHAADCLRLAAGHRDDFVKVTRCRAQANAMTRQMDRSLRILTALRKERGARETAQAVFNAMQAGLKMPREPVPVLALRESDPLPEPPLAPDPAPETTAAPGDPISPAALAKAVQFARHNRMLAARIRAAGGLTRAAIAGFRPASLPDAETVKALVNGADPVLTALEPKTAAAA
jgi:hypothetical protein